MGSYRKGKTEKKNNNRIENLHKFFFNNIYVRVGTNYTFISFVLHYGISVSCRLCTINLNDGTTGVFISFIYI